MRRRGQSTIEIVVLIAVIAIAVLSMNRYVRRAIMGRLKSSADQLGSQFSVTGINNINLTTTVNVEYDSVQTWGGAENKTYTKKVVNSEVNVELKPLNEEKFLEP